MRDDCSSPSATNSRPRRKNADMTTRGISLALAGGVREAQDITRRAEQAGFDAAWSGEFLNRSAIVSVAAMAAVTERIGVGSAIAYAVGRTPLVLANDARFLDEMSGGRVTLGLGTGTRRMMEGWHGVTDAEGPATRMEELIPLLRRLWRLHEGPVKHQRPVLLRGHHADRRHRATAAHRDPDLHRRRQSPHGRGGRPSRRRPHVPPDVDRPLSHRRGPAGGGTRRREDRARVHERRHHGCRRSAPSPRTPRPRVARRQHRSPSTSPRRRTVP